MFSRGYRESALPGNSRSNTHTRMLLPLGLMLMNGGEDTDARGERALVAGSSKWSKQGRARIGFFRCTPMIEGERAPVGAAWSFTD